MRTRLNGMNVARRRNPSPPAGDLTVTTASGQQVNTTPAFVDANGKLFAYDDYIKAALLNRFPKDDAIPFYAITANQKANAVYEKNGAWAKKSNELPYQTLDAVRRELNRREGGPRVPYERVDLSKFENYFLRVFPSKEFFDAFGGTDVSEAAKEMARDMARAHLALMYFNIRTSPGNAPRENAFALNLAIEKAGGLNTTPPLSSATIAPIWNHYKWILHHPESRAQVDALMEGEKAKLRESMRSGGPLGGSVHSSSEMTPAATGSHSTPPEGISGMQHAQAQMINETLFGRKNPRPRLNGMNVGRRR